jgi:hypothetical protein
MTDFTKTKYDSLSKVSAEKYLKMSNDFMAQINKDWNTLTPKQHMSIKKALDDLHTNPTFSAKLGDNQKDPTNDIAIKLGIKTF